MAYSREVVIRLLQFYFQLTYVRYQSNVLMFPIEVLSLTFQMKQKILLSIKIKMNSGGSFGATFSKLEATGYMKKWPLVSYWSATLKRPPRKEKRLETAAVYRHLKIVHT